MRQVRAWRVVVFSLSCLFCSSCGLMNFIRSYTNVNGASQTITEEHAYPSGSLFLYTMSGPTNAVREVNVSQELELLSGNSVECKTDWSAWSSQDAGTCLDKALGDFRKFSKDNPTEAAKARNDLQERLIMASNSACREFAQHLNTMQSTSNFFFGTLATGAGAAAAIVSSTVAAKALGGSAGAISGTRAEYNADYFYNQAAPVVTRSIDDRRRTFLAALRGYEIPSGMTPLPQPSTPSKATGSDSANAKVDPPSDKNDPSDPNKPIQTAASLDAQGELGFQTLPPQGFQALSIDRYPVEAAIADAIYYNDLCSLDKGLENITTALVIAKHPGLDELVAAQDSENQLLQKQLDGEKIRKQEAEAEAETQYAQNKGSTLSIARPDSFPTTSVGNTSSAKPLIITNRSSAAVTLGSPIFENGDEFIKGPTDTCSGQNLSAGGACQITIQFKPRKKGERQGYIAIVANPDPRSPHKIPLNGKGD